MKKNAQKSGLTSEQISADIEKFLDDGGKIEKIPRGVTSGQEAKYGRSIEARDAKPKQNS